MNETVNASNEEEECPRNDIYPFAIVAASSGVVSALCCIFVICLIFLLKKHYFFIQRLILYHCLAALFDSFAKVLALQYLRYDPQSTGQDTLCAMSGFITLLASWILIVDYSVISFTLLMTAVFHKNVIKLEPLYVAMIFVLPLTFTWIPFIGNSYGEHSGQCWIRSINYDDCTEHHLGEIFTNVLWDVPLFSILVILIPTYLFTIAHATRERCRKTKMSRYNDPENEKLKKELEMAKASGIDSEIRKWEKRLASCESEIAKIQESIAKLDKMIEEHEMIVKRGQSFAQVEYREISDSHAAAKKANDEKDAKIQELRSKNQRLKGSNEKLKTLNEQLKTSMKDCQVLNNCLHAQLHNPLCQCMKDGKNSFAIEYPNTCISKHRKK